MAVQLIGGRKVITRENPIFTDRLTNYSDRQSILHIAGQGYDPAEHVSATEAFRRQGLLDLHYEKQPLYITVNGTQMPTDLFAIVETNGAGTQRVIGDPVAKGYHLIQNADLAAGLLDAAADRALRRDTAVERRGGGEPDRHGRDQ